MVDPGGDPFSLIYPNREGMAHHQKRHRMAPRMYEMHKPETQPLRQSQRRTVCSKHETQTRDHFAQSMDPTTTHILGVVIVGGTPPTNKATAARCLCYVVEWSPLLHIEPKGTNSTPPTRRTEDARHPPQAMAQAPPSAGLARATTHSGGKRWPEAAGRVGPGGAMSTCRDVYLRREAKSSGGRVTKAQTSAAQHKTNQGAN